MAEQVGPEVRVYPDLNAASKAAAEELVSLILDSVSERGRFAIALSGGSTPRILYTLLADTYSDQIPWDSVHIFWGDERYVPKNHKDSNYGMADRALVSKVPIPSQNVHRIQTKAETPDKAASSYERVLREFFHSAQADESIPTFDLTLLGVGNDGHTASLFPGDPVLEERDRWVAAVDASPEAHPRERITLTLPVINRSRNVFFIASGSKKRKVVKSIIENKADAIELYPAAMVRPIEKTVWFVDAEVVNETMTLE